MFCTAVTAVAAAVVYTERADTPGEQAARLYGCYLCHGCRFEREIMIPDRRHGEPLFPMLRQHIAEAHPLLPDNAAEDVAEHFLPFQQELQAQQHATDAADALYRAKCAACHGNDGNGSPGQFPPLNGSEWMNESQLNEVLADGVQGEISVKGAQWNATMRPPGVPEDKRSGLIRYLLRRFAPAGSAGGA